MFDMLQQSQSAQAPSSTGSAADAAELARVDQQLELAAKKTALNAMQRGGADAGSDAPAAPVAQNGGTNRIVITRGDNTTVLENPTAEQLKAAGVGTTEAHSGDVSGWQAVALTCGIMWGIVTIVYLVLAHRRRIAGVTRLDTAQTDSRMARIENAVESIAVEVERISEGQRFTSKLLAEGAAKPVNGAVNVPEILGAVLKNRGGG
jgi:hypothetical protein